MPAVGSGPGRPGGRGAHGWSPDGHAPFRYVRNLTSSKESWVPASSLSTLLGTSGSAQCLSSSGKTPGPRGPRPEPAGFHSRELERADTQPQPFLPGFPAESSAGSALLSTSSSCSESCGAPLSDLQG